MVVVDVIAEIKRRWKDGLRKGETAEERSSGGCNSKNEERHRQSRKMKRAGDIGSGSCADTRNQEKQR